LITIDKAKTAIVYSSWLLYKSRRPTAIVTFMHVLQYIAAGIFGILAGINKTACRVRCRLRNICTLPKLLWGGLVPHANKYSNDFWSCFSVLFLFHFTCKHLLCHVEPICVCW